MSIWTAFLLTTAGFFGLITLGASNGYCAFATETVFGTFLVLALTSLALDLRERWE